MEKIIDLEEKIPTLRAKRRRRTNRKFSTLLAIFSLLIVSILYFRSPYSTILHLEVNGEQLVDEQFYFQTSTLKEGLSMWEFRTAAIENKIRKMNWVKDVQVKRTGLTEVTISVDEWSKQAFIEKDGNYFIVLENGEIFLKQGTISLIDGPILIDFNNSKTRRSIVKQLSLLRPEVYELVSEIYAIEVKPNSDVYTLQAFLNDGNEVRANIGDFAKRMNYYPSIISQIGTNTKGIVDFEVGSFFQPYEEIYKIELPQGEETDETDNQTSTE